MDNVELEFGDKVTVDDREYRYLQDIELRGGRFCYVWSLEFRLSRVVAKKDCVKI